MMTPDPNGITPAWFDAAETPRFEPLASDIDTDCCVIGGGIAGLTTALLLARAGRKVVVLERHRIGHAMTGHTTAHLASALDDRFTEIERLHGKPATRLAWLSHAEAIDLIESVVHSESVECDFRRVDGYLTCGSEPFDLDEEYEAATRAGIPVEWLGNGPMNFPGPALKFAAQAQFHPLKYLAGLCRILVREGVQIHENTPAGEVADGTPVRVTVGDHAVNAAQVVVATNVPINDRVAIHTKQAPYLTYVIAAPIPRDSFEPALIWDTDDPYHYVRSQRCDQQHDLLIVGGEDHKTGQANDGDERLLRLENWMRSRFPLAGQISHTWLGQVMEPVDGLAFIGRNPGDENVYVATGDSGMGMTHGTIAGILNTALITAGDHPWATLYDPSRKTVGSLATFARENLNVAGQYTDWVTPGEVNSADQIPPGSGAIVRSGLVKQACYRDPQGVLRISSATCPHLGCIVAWNNTAGTWDCPCHGSRFTAEGEVVSGPANRGLERLDS